MKTNLKELIAKGKVQEVIQELLALTDRNGDTSLHDEVAVLSSQYEQFARDKSMQVSTHAEQTVASAKINQAVLSIIDRVDRPKSEWTKDVVKSPNGKQGESSVEGKSNKSLWKYITMAAVIIGIFGSLAEIFNVINLFPSSSNDSNQLTIYVHGPKGQQDYVLESAGELLVDFDGDRRSSKIGEKGRTVFNEIPSKFMGKKLPIFVKAKGYESANPGKQYIFGDKPIYYAIQKEKGLGLIKGIVKTDDGSDFIANVTVIIDNEFNVLTDSLGRINFEMPGDQVKDKYSLTLKKEGYETSTEFYYPNSTSEFRLHKKNSK